MREHNEPYPFHTERPKTWHEVLGEREGARALRQEIRAEFPCRPGLWDYCMIAAGTVSCLIASPVARRLLDKAAWIASVALIGGCTALAGCGGGTAEEDAAAQTKSTTIPVDCGGGITCR